MQKSILLTTLFAASASAYHPCDGGNEITDAVEGAVVGGVVGAVAGNASAGAAIGATAGVISGAYDEIDCDNYLADEIVADAVQEDIEDEIVADALWD
ncbi:DUF1269 domain-containing protein [Vibrio sp. ZSDZ65]|uniref:DUF1269 domain-containing protein n=1 Tax=Vibrio qingdaonensis TaxID=2829491 RepID=A0A9X3CPR5_9VIBR|nr:glycine zipper family protein [Vibrio qingdaonensis]MCW8347176.1 DUF1269 domain-containing protein [Vibrio qingdaonensis]